VTGITKLKYVLELLRNYFKSLNLEGNTRIYNCAAN